MSFKNEHDKNILSPVGVVKYSKNGKIVVLFLCYQRLNYTHTHTHISTYYYNVHFVLYDYIVYGQIFYYSVCIMHACTYKDSICVRARARSCNVLIFRYLFFPIEFFLCARLSSNTTVRRTTCDSTVYMHVRTTFVNIMIMFFSRCPNTHADEYLYVYLLAYRVRVASPIRKPFCRFIDGNGLRPLPFGRTVDAHAPTTIGDPNSRTKCRTRAHRNTRRDTLRKLNALYNDEKRQNRV